MRTLVLGAGVSGVAAARLATRLGWPVEGFDEEPAAAKAAHLVTGVPFGGGEWDGAPLEDAELVVASPGIPEHSEMIQSVLGSGLPLWSELEFAARVAQAPLLAVTGTNGKTSTVAAAQAMLEASGAKVCAAGNIGTALSDVAEEAWDVIVVEASSFQLRFIDSFHPSGAALLNVSPDHLDWHGSFEAYAGAKTNLIRNLTRSDVFVFGAGDAVAEQAAASTVARPVPVSGSVIPPGGVGVEDGVLHLGADTIEAPDLGPDFLSDLAAAAVLARHEGATVAGISSAMASFVPGPHRRRTIGEWDGVQWVDDSKATNPEAAAAAAEAYASVVLIAGGRNKGLDLAPMAAPASIRRVVTLGESAADLNALFGAIAATAESMEDAVRMAREVAREGDTVLLAPGCASFDMFDSYADRGDRFAAAARTQAGGDGH